MTLYVNGEKVDDQAIKDESEKLRPQYDQVFAEMPEEEREKQLTDWSRENVIEGVLLRQAAMKDPDGPPPDAVDKAYADMIEQSGGKEQFFQQMGLAPDQEDKVKKDIEQRMRLEKLIEKVTSAAGEPSEKDIRKHYEQNKEKFTIPEMVRAAHIVKHVKPIDDPEKLKAEMDEIRAQMDENTDFAEIAAKHSECPENGGDLGFFARGQMVQQFEEVVFDMEKGRISDVFQTEFGYHIAKVLEKKPSIPCPIDEVRQVIVKELSEQTQQRAIEKFVDAEKEKATIEDK